MSRAAGMVPRRLCILADASSVDDKVYPANRLE
jgi:hypothetical protein